MQLEREKDTSSMYHQRYRATDMELRDKQKEMVILRLWESWAKAAGHKWTITDVNNLLGLQFVRLGVDRWRLYECKQAIELNANITGPGITPFF